ncbi:MAG: D-alanyl-D-alanine carboxypeptidase [Clostridia bacterium]|nr:D-alanyl-D-alanine carboxypeptidase [Clostridia bacterium]
MVYDPLSRQIVSGEGEEEWGRIASTTKLMTALVAVERADLWREITILPEYTTVEGSKMYLKAGEKRSVEELLYGLLLASGNDAALALAGGIGGSVEQFVGWMNQTARSLGMEKTSFENPTGLDGSHHGASPRDMAILMEAVLQEERLTKILAAKYRSFDGYVLKNHNKLLWLSKECIGGKTGFTKAAGRCLVSAFSRYGRRVVVVTLNTAKDWETHMTLAKNFLDGVELVTGSALLSLPVVNGWESEAILRVDYNLPLLDGEEEKLEFRLYAPHFLYEMPTPGESMGQVEIFLGGNRVGKGVAVALGREMVK